VDLQDADSFDAFQRWLTGNPVLHLKVERQPDYYRRTTAEDVVFFRALAYTIGLIMAVGAVFGVTKILYAMVNVRTYEIATLRVVGFSASAVVLSVLAGASLLAP
jgi:putative ABC transport system permease protein